MGDGELNRKARENRARRAAARQGLRLVKNRRRDARAADYGSYLLLSRATGQAVADFGWGQAGSGDHLAEAEEWLARGWRPGRAHHAQRQEPQAGGRT